ncbi:MAG: TetR/AcrR family transcriptional regulator [Sphingobium sp.]
MTDVDTTFKPRRGRPNAKQLVAIEQTILSTAKTLFFEEGYDAVAMEGIAAVAGVSKGTLYARYASKEALFTAVVQNSVQEWSRLAASHDTLLKDDLELRLRHHARTIASYLLTPDVQALTKLLIANRDRFPEFARVMYDRGYLYIVNLIAQEIVAAAARDGIPAKAPEAVARKLVAALFGWHLEESSGRQVTPLEMQTAADEYVTLFIAARATW